MIQLKTPQQIDGIREACHLTARLMNSLSSYLEPGMSTHDIDQHCYDFIIHHKGKPAFLNYEGFPATACISINEEVIHGIPSRSRKIALGDLVDIDLGINMNGYFSDMARTFIVGGVTKPEWDKLCKVTEKCLVVGIEAAGKRNARIQDIGDAVFKLANSHGYGVVRDYCGHGVGLAVHEEPEVPNYTSSYMPNPRIREGMVLAIEPMINLGTKNIRESENGWTVLTADGKPSVHFEDTVAITKNGLEILTVED
ncbi:methionine aminopeptidase, type I [Sphaerochaeta pleomorpha str. Grapes]|uniref:Methionine aminopeptidase n=1 Tax=Sphaerochaeta pleomorpha (strain ATCC BAA-1885 / DSM 22778 / Grapes) TaxID=158190 RepID=G8QVJ0_SPHPG|nr:type I methionyl aminopeptidase [Sphaerochaeta pleomorpha]AEV28223.1 methionine aminopeptidase, type I [Sphaerochaeta pleomorpha str. Grapes]